MRRMIDKIILLMLITSIGFVSNVTAIPLVQSVELGTHAADGNTYIDVTATSTGIGKIKFVVDNDNRFVDWTNVDGTNVKTKRNYMGNIDNTGQITIPFIVGSTHSICVINSADITDKVCASITIPVLTKELVVTDLDIKRSDTGYITATIFYTGTGIIGVNYDNSVDQTTVTTPDSYVVIKLLTPITAPGTYNICAYNSNNYDAGQVCKTLEISNLYTISITKLYVNNTGIPGEGWITVDVTTTGSGTLGFDIDNVLVWTRIVNVEDGGIGTQFKTTSGSRTICVYDYLITYNPTNTCKDINVLSAPNIDIDEENPVIISVDLKPPTPFVGDSITVTVNAIDNVKVTSVTANGNPMTFYDRTDIDSYWESTLIAKIGTNIVSIEAKDAAGNNAKDSATYTAIEKPIENLTLETYTTSKGLIPTVTNIPKKPNFGKLFVDSSPNSAVIYINGISSGLTPKSFEYPRGGLEVKIKKDGYKEYIKKVIITENGIAEVTVKLILLSNTTNYTNGDTKTGNDNETIPKNDENITKNNETTTLDDKEKTDKDKTLWGIFLVITIILVIGFVYYKYSLLLRDDIPDENIGSDVEPKEK